MKKNFLRRMTRGKSTTPGEPEEGYEIPPPTAIEPGVPYSAEAAEGEDYDSHMELELLAADEPTRTDLTNGKNVHESDPAPALESLTEPVSDESVNESEPQSEAALYEEYGLDLEPLGEPEADGSPEEVEPPREDEETAACVAEKAVEPPDLEPEVFVESDTETIGDAPLEFAEASGAAESAVKGYSPVAPEIPEESGVRVIDDAASEDEEPTAAADAAETRDTPVPQSEAALYEEYGLDLEPLNETEPEAAPEAMHEPSLEDEAAASEALESVMEASASESEVQQEAEPEAPRNLQEKMQDQFDTSLIIKAARKKEVEESLAASVSEEPPDEDEPLLEREEPAPDAAESVVEVAASETEIPGESEPEAAADITKADEPLAASVSPESPEESPEPSRMENGVFPLVRDARGDWRPGKGFSRSELREAGLSPAEAARLHIRVDKRRRGAHPVNVATLERAKSGV